jgi:predicted PurR-regulated permease PerM
MQKLRMERASFLTVLLLTTAAFLWLVRGYLEPVFWAAVMAIIFRPLYEFWVRKTRQRPRAAAALSVLTVIVVVLLPLTLVGLAVSSESVAFYARIESGEVNPIGWLQQIPIPEALLARLPVDRAQIMERLSTAAVGASQYVGTQLFAIGQSALHALIGLGIMLYLLYFFFRDGAALVEKLVRTLPLGDRREHKLFASFAAVARATIKGSLVVGIVQGLLGGLIFGIAGIGAPVLWGTLMALLSVIPAVGSSIIWIPGGIILLAGGQYWQGTFVLAGGVLLISMADNLLRPMLVGKTTQLPDALILISTIGGISVFGLAGIVAGPIIAAFFVSVWQMFEAEYGAED